MNILRRVTSVRSASGHCCPKCHIHLDLTGAPSRNGAERLVEKIARGKEALSFHQMEQEVSLALYHEELLRGASAVDIGLMGPCAFRAAAARILEELRPEFGRFHKSDTIQPWNR